MMKRSDFLEKYYDITEFGAREADTLQTEAIQAAIDACYKNGGGWVVIPEGRFMTGDIRLRSGVGLYLKSGAILKGSPDPEEYMHYLSDTVDPLPPYTGDPQKRSVDPYSRWNSGLIKAVGAEKIAIVGEPGSYIDGSNVFDPQGEEGYRGPHAINMHYCRDILFEGYTIMDSGNWAHNICVSQNITVRKVKVLGMTALQVLIITMSMCAIAFWIPPAARYGLGEPRFWWRIANPLPPPATVTVGA